MKQTFLCLWISILLSTTLPAQTDNTVYKTIPDLPYRTGDNLTSYMKERCRLDLYYPVNKTDFSTVVWFHGGGLTGGSKSVPEKLKGLGLAVAAVNYRLHPQVKCPEYIEDAAAAIAWVFRNIPEYGGSPRKIIVAGSSAGGYLTLMAGLDKRYLAAHGVNADSIFMLFPFSGHTVTHFTIRKESGIPDKQAVVDEYAPLFHARAGAPPVFLFSGGRDLEMLGRYEENAYLWRMMKLNGHKDCHLFEFDGFGHGDMSVPGFHMMVKILKERGVIK